MVSFMQCWVDPLIWGSEFSFKTKNYKQTKKKTKNANIKSHKTNIQILISSLFSVVLLINHASLLSFAGKININKNKMLFFRRTEGTPAEPAG